MRHKTVEVNGIKVTVTESDEDGKPVVFIDTPPSTEAEYGPDIRVWLNDALMYEEGEVGKDLTERRG